MEGVGISTTNRIKRVAKQFLNFLFVSGTGWIIDFSILLHISG